jgi:putative molybdopterin biosynthesis protein
MKEMLDAREVAEYLRIHMRQVYRLIKERKIPATKITGKWLFPKKLIDEFIMNSARERIGTPSEKTTSGSRVVIGGSNDLALELLIKNTNVWYPQYSISSISSMGSLAALIALKNGNCQVAAANLLDLETGEYNSTFIEKHFPELRGIILNLAHREQGLMVRRGNPLGIKTLGDLVRTKGSFVNRQEESGTRVLSDFLFKENGIDPASISGYDRIALTHMEVALEIFNGLADAGIGISAVARIFKLDFIPLATERFDLIIPSENCTAGCVKALRKVLSSEEFKLSIARMGGYETRETGKIMHAHV